MLTVIRILHTVVWAFFAACIAGIFVAAHAERLRLAAARVGVVLAVGGPFAGVEEADDVEALRGNHGVEG